MADIQIPDLEQASQINTSDQFHIRQGTVDKKADASLLSTTLGLDGFLEKTQNLSDLDNAATARSNLGLATGATTTVGTVATRDVGESATQIPDMSSFDSFLNTNGRYRLPGGLELRWGEHLYGDPRGGGQNPNVVYPVPFSNSTLLVVGSCAYRGNSLAYNLYVNNNSYSATGFSLLADEWASAFQQARFNYLAIGF